MPFKIDPRITVLLQLFGVPTTAIPLIQAGATALAGVRGAQSDADRIAGINDLLGVVSGLRQVVGGADEPLSAAQIEQAIKEIEVDDLMANKQFDNTKK